MTDSFEQLSDKELEVGYWWTVHRLKIKAAFLMLVILGIIAIYVNAGWRFYVYLKGTSVHEEMLSELTSSAVNYEQIRRSSGPRDLKLNNAVLISRGNSFYDIVAEVENTNQRWWLRQLNYQFEIDGQLTEERSIYVLPGEDKYLYHFNFQSQAAPSRYRLVIKREIWQRVKNFDTQTAVWRPANIEISNLRYSPTLLGVSQGVVDFSVTNNSSYNFWEIDMQILLWQGQKLVDFNAVSIADLEVAKSRLMEVLMAKGLPAGLRPEVIVSANSLAEENIKSFNTNQPGFIR